MPLKISLGVRWLESEADLSLPSSALRLRIRESGPLLPHTLSGLHSYKYIFLLTLQQNHYICTATTKTLIQWYRALREGTISEPWLRNFENCRMNVHDDSTVRARASGKDVSAA